MDRLEAFERMLSDIRAQAASEEAKMDALSAAGKERTATYRQYFANRMLYRMMLDRYRAYGLLSGDSD